MRLSAQPECSRALMQASMTACVISSTCSELIPISRARLATARAAAISMSGTIGRVNSICRSAVAVIGTSCRENRSEGQEHGYSRFDPGRDLSETVEGQKREGIDRQHHGKSVGRSVCQCVAAGCFCDVVHGGPPRVSGHPYRNATATLRRPSCVHLSL